MSKLVTRFVQPERRVSINDQSFHESRPQQSLHCLKFLPACAKQDHFPLVEVLEINCECPLIHIARHDLSLGIEKFAHAVADSPGALEILQFNS